MATIGEKMTAVANAIRAKTGGTGKLTLDQMASSLNGITNRDSSSLTASGATVSVPAGNYKTAASKSVATATQATPSISIDSAGKITASTTQSAGYVAAGTKSATKQLTVQAAKTITPSTSSQTAVSSGVYTTGAITVKGDANLKSSNIKSGVSIFGVTGTVAELFEGVPKFTYDGSYSIVDSTASSWKIKFTSSGTLRFTEIGSAIDIFVVGGGGGGGVSSSGNIGGGGGGGGKTASSFANVVKINTDYSIVVGSGGASATNGGTSSAFGISANGGDAGKARDGGSGGSGGGYGGYSNDYAAGAGATNGGSVGTMTSYGGTIHKGGTGQGTTTREFGETSTSYSLYGGGGGGGSGKNGGGSAGSAGAGSTAANGGGGAGGKGTAGTNGAANTGGGGGGGSYSGFAGGQGGSGIVIIRRAV